MHLGMYGDVSISGLKSLIRQSLYKLIIGEMILPSRNIVYVSYLGQLIFFCFYAVYILGVL